MMPPEQRFRHIYLEKRNNQERTFSKYLFKNDFFFFQIIHLETIWKEIIGFRKFQASIYIHIFSK